MPVMNLLARIFTGPIMVLAGILHFAKPEPYEQIMPDYLPAHRQLVYASGVAEIAGATLSMIPRTRRLGGWFSIATLLAVFPANLHMAIHADRYEKAVPGGRAGLLARLPLQGVMLWLVYRATLRQPSA
jgi:uncharacterized membrane protein